MQFNRAVAFANLALIGLAVVAEFLLPAYSTLIFYGLLLWMIVSLALFYGPGRGRTVGGGGGGSAGGWNGTSPALSTPAPGASGPPRSLDFCVYCGTPLLAGATACAVCGKTARPI